MTSLQAVLKALPSLKSGELKEVRTRLDILSEFNRPEVVSDWLSEGVVFELRRRGLLRKGGIHWRRLAPKRYTVDSHLVREYLLEGVGRALTSVEQYALGRVAARALADYLVNTPGFGLRVMLAQVAKIPEALDASFPGYVKDRMLGLTIKGKAK